MCEAIDFAIGVVLGLKKEKVFHTINYDNKTLNSNQCNYTNDRERNIGSSFCLQEVPPIFDSE